LPGSDAAEYLVAHGEDPQDLNVFAARRGNWEVMLRGLFTNKSVRNLLGPNLQAERLFYAGTGSVLPLQIAAERYQSEGAPVVIVAGERYGTGSRATGPPKALAVGRARGTGGRLRADPSVEPHRHGILPIILPVRVVAFRLGIAVGDLFQIDASPSRLSAAAPLSVSLRRRFGEISSVTATVLSKRPWKCRCSGMAASFHTSCGAFPRRRDTYEDTCSARRWYRPEITRSTLDVLRAADEVFSFGLEFQTRDIGLASLKSQGTTLPSEVMKLVRKWME